MSIEHLTANVLHEVGRPPVSHRYMVWYVTEHNNLEYNSEWDNVEEAAKRADVISTKCCHVRIVSLRLE